MAGTEISSSVPVDELPDGFAAELNAGEPEGGADAAVEARARDMGWKPLAEYRGPPGRWQPAADFISRGENILPIVRDQNRRMTERIGKLEGEVTSLRTTAGEQLQIIKELRDVGLRQNQAGYDRAMADIKAKQRQAADAGDLKSFDQLVEQQEALQAARATATPAAPEPPRPATTEPPRPPMSAPTQQFLAANAWFSNDTLLASTMTSFHQEVLNERQINQEMLNADPALDRELLEEAKARVVDRYPERFPNQAVARETQRPQRQRRAAVATPTPDAPAQRPGAAPTINSITDPAERAQAREAFNRMRRQLPDYTEAEYMALYDDPHADILVEQQKRKAQPNGR